MDETCEFSIADSRFFVSLSPTLAFPGANLCFTEAEVVTDFVMDYLVNQAPDGRRISTSVCFNTTLIDGNFVRQDAAVISAALR